MSGLEQIRYKHEEIERLEQLIMKDLMREELSPMEQWAQGHRLRSMTKSLIVKTEKLVKTYEEKEEEIASMLFGDETEIWTAFTNRLKEIHEYHGKHPSGPLVDVADYELLEVDGPQTEKLCNSLDEFLIEEMVEEEKPPMSWDGKPIPYWLNKLGLGQEYKCEICENHSYCGKKFFEEHFQEWRHQWALSFLGIIDTEKKLNGITSIEEAKRVWKSQGGQCKDEKEIIKQKNKKSKPPPCITLAMDELARKGSEDEMLSKLIEFHKVSPYYDDCDIETHGLADQDLNLPPLSLPLHKFTYTLPQGITAKELDIMKLAAEFWARYESRFSLRFKKIMVNDDPYFEFMKKPSEGRYMLFGELIHAYSEVLVHPPLQVLKEDLRNNAADMETILENCYHRLQRQRFQSDYFQKKAKEARAKAKLPRRALGLSLITSKTPQYF